MEILNREHREAKWGGEKGIPVPDMGRVVVADARRLTKRLPGEKTEKKKGIPDTQVK